MKTSIVTPILLICIFVGITSIDARATMTIATFSDPSNNSTNPLFTVDFTQMTLNGGWSDAKTGLLLNVPYSGHTFADAWFKMDEVSITSAITTFGTTGPGEIDFYKDGTSTNPLVVFTFNSGFVSQYGFGADGIFTANNVTISGSEITGTFSEEQFSFSFANLALLRGHNNWNDGFTATAAFTSSAVPEPTTICLLGLGALGLLRKRRA